jgi:predicted anti-sigma-YlaC factor YlaD
MRECARIKRMLSRYLDEETNGADKAAIEKHLAGCLSCREELSGLVDIKGLVSGMERKILPQNYLVSRVYEKITDKRRLIERFSLAGMGIFARKLIPVPVAAIIISIMLLILTSAQPITKNSLEDYIFSGNAVTSEAALELILGTQN